MTGRRETGDDLFVGRHRALADVVGWLGRGAEGLLVLTGSPGCGKSMLLRRLTRLAEPAARARLTARGELRAGDPDPGERGVDALVPLRGLATRQIAAALTAPLGLPEPRTPAEALALLAAGRHRGGRPPVLLLDGLDEAADAPDRLVEELLDPLSRLATVVVGVRSDLLRTLSAATPETAAQSVLRKARLLDLDQEPETEDDLAQYLRLRLTAAGRTEVEADGAARSLAGMCVRGGGGFLLASLLSALATAEPQHGRPVGRPESVEAAFARMLDACPPLRPDGTPPPRALRTPLTALAWSRGAGLPADEVWAAMATALEGTGRTWSVEDVRFVVEHHGHLLVSATDASGTVHRLSHEVLARYLLDEAWNPPLSDGAPPALAITRALTGLTLDRCAGQQPPAPAHPYVVGHLADHAAAAGTAGVSLLRAAAETAPGVFRPVLASALERFAVQLSRRGERWSAVAPADEAVALRRLLAGTYTSDAARELADSLVVLADVQADAGDRFGALLAASEAVSIRRGLAAADPSAFLAELAAALNTLAERQAQVGDRASALSSATESVDLLRELNAANPTAYRPTLAGALNNLSARQADAGDRRSALATATRAAALFREVVAAEGRGFLPGLAHALGNLATCQSKAGERLSAVPHARESVELLRGLAEDEPARFLPDLAGRLSTLGSVLALNGGRGPALAAATEAAALMRGLAESDPGTFVPDLAGFLDNLAVRQAQVGDREGALATVQEAVSLYRELAASHPDAFLPDLAGVLNNLGNALARVGEHRVALDTAQEAAELCRRLAGTDPDAFLPSLAGALSNLGNRLARVGEHRAALDAVQDASELRRRLAATNPNAFLPDLARTLNNLGNRLARVGEHRAALDAATEAALIFRQLVDSAPDAFLPSLAGALSNLGNRLARVGEHRAALDTTLEATELRRRLAATNPNAFLPDLARTLNDLGSRLARLGEHRAALDALTEAAGLHGELPGTEREISLGRLVAGMNHLADRLHRESGTEQALAVYDAVERSPGLAAAEVHRLGYERAAFRIRAGDPSAGAEALIPLLSAEPDRAVDAYTRQLCRSALRTLATGSPEGARLVSAAWARAGHGAEPRWLRIDEEALEFVDAWLACPTWTDSQAFWETHEAALRTPEVQAALGERALLEPDLVRLHQVVLDRAAERGADEAFRPFVLGELAADWMAAPDWRRSKAFLAEHADRLLHSDAAVALGDSTEPEVLVHLALLRLAGALGVPDAYACVEDRAALHRQVQRTLRDADAALLAACAALERFVFQDEFAGVVHESAAAVLELRPSALQAEPAVPVDDTTRNRTAAEISELRRRRPELADELGRLLDQVLTAGAPTSLPRPRRHLSDRTASRP
ncbi:AAA family ATPase [Kitasatospora griseola]|uniref:AAA family ATPase n=1 Tax=Kitasatospora griseola TaxID=2064 RepID=UPI0036DC6760